MQDVIELNLNLAELRQLMQNNSLSKPLMEYLQRSHERLLGMQLRTLQFTNDEIGIVKIALNLMESDLPEYHNVLRKLGVSHAD